MTILIEESFDHVSIEGIRLAYSSCFSCGVCWFEEHASLDCRECDGYALVRPCPSCDGRCGKKWTRNLQASHARLRATWDGCCGMEEGKPTQLPQLPIRHPLSTVKSSSSTPGSSPSDNLLHSRSSQQPLLLTAS